MYSVANCSTKPTNEPNLLRGNMQVRCYIYATFMPVQAEPRQCLQWAGALLLVGLCGRFCVTPCNAKNA